MNVSRCATMTVSDQCGGMATGVFTLPAGSRRRLEDEITDARAMAKGQILQVRMRR